jgi:dsDNA-specific endonuclease/ATPase MutS2
MILGEAIDSVYGLGEMARALELRSGSAWRVLCDTAMMTSSEEIEREQELVERTAAALSDAGREGTLEALALRLGQVKELRGTMARLAAGRTLDDVELFELKVFAMTARAIAQLTAAARLDVVALPDTAAVVALLDPDGSAIPHFSIYDAYSPALSDVRRRLRLGLTPELVDENARLEDEVRAALSERLRVFAPLLEAAAQGLARLDILIAKARQARRLGLCRPVVAKGETTGETRYAGLFHPPIREALRLRGKDFQPVDIAFGADPTVITGANMGGKTVLLESVALAQALFQFGFHVPAREATISPVDEILTAIGETPEATAEAGGLSSFAAEMVRLDVIIRRVREGAQPLVLIDEPARTTNPAEGGAIVDALLDLLATHHVRSLVTTHYSVRARVRRLKVKGLSDDATTMNYSLTLDDGRAPREALRIARILGVDDELIDKAAKYLL